jgi:uncharacterized membrane protein
MSNEPVQTDPPASPGASSKPQTIAENRVQIIEFCAVGLMICFFLPWVSFLGAMPSGFDLQKFGDKYLLLWLVPIFSGITLFAAITKRGLQVIGQITGALPFIVGICWLTQIGKDLLQIMTYGAYLSLFFGAALFILARKEKRT